MKAGRRRETAPQGALASVAGFGANPGALRMKVHVPQGLPAGAALVVALHGCGQTAEAYERGSGWAALAERHGFVLVCPEQSRRNNPNTCFNWFQPRGRGAAEAASIRQMVAHATDAWDLDETQVFVVGLSAGGAMAALLLALYPGVFRGAGIIAGVPYGAASNVMEALGVMRQAPSRPPERWAGEVRAASPHAGPWPTVSIWQGQADERVDASNADVLVAQWKTLHGLAGPPVCTEAAGRVHEAWRAPDGRVLLESWRFADMAHGEPVAAASGLGAPEPYFLETGVSAAATLAAAWGLTARKARVAPPRGESAPPPRRPSLLRRLARALGL